MSRAVQENMGLEFSLPASRLAAKDAETDYDLFFKTWCICPYVTVYSSLNDKS